MSAITMARPVLDLCCGDGYFSSLVFPNGLEAGCDVSGPAVDIARARGLHSEVAQSDISRSIPWEPETFRTVVSNSSLEHIVEIDAALREVSRVLQPGGNFVATLASNYAYEWWPCGSRALEDYLRYQPVHNRFSVDEWSTHLAAAGLTLLGYRYYFSRAATRFAMWLDYHFSRAYLTNDLCLGSVVVRRLLPRVPGLALTELWSAVLGRISLDAVDPGGGILMVARK